MYRIYEKGGIESLQPDVVKPSIFTTMYSVGQTNPSLTYQRLTPSDCKDIRIRKFDIVTKT